MRLLTVLLAGLLLATAFLGIVFMTDGAPLHLHWLRDIFIGPPLWLLQTGLPAISQMFVIDRGSLYRGMSFFLAFFVAFWWLVCCVVLSLAFTRSPKKMMVPKQ